MGKMTAEQKKVVKAQKKLEDAQAAELAAKTPKVEGETAKQPDLEHEAPKPTLRLPLKEMFAEASLIEKEEHETAAKLKDLKVRRSAVIEEIYAAKGHGPYMVDGEKWEIRHSATGAAYFRKPSQSEAIELE